VATPADDAEEWSKDHLVRWLRSPSTPVLKSSRMSRDAEEWSEDHDAAEWSEDHSGAGPSTIPLRHRSNFASKRA
jgi:hypothetical protein